MPITPATVASPSRMAVQFPLAVRSGCSPLAQQLDAFTLAAASSPNFPARHASPVHVADSSMAENFPGTQLSHRLSQLSSSTYFPAGQRSVEQSVPPPASLFHFPTGQAVQLTAFTLVAAFAPNFPARHASPVHVADSSMAENFPGTQFSHRLSQLSVILLHVLSRRAKAHVRQHMQRCQSQSEAVATEKSRRPTCATM